MSYNILINTCYDFCKQLVKLIGYIDYNNLLILSKATHVIYKKIYKESPKLVYGIIKVKIISFYDKSIIYDPLLQLNYYISEGIKEGRANTNKYYNDITFQYRNDQLQNISIKYKEDKNYILEEQIYKYNKLDSVKIYISYHINNKNNNKDNITYDHLLMQSTSLLDLDNYKIIIYDYYMDFIIEQYQKKNDIYYYKDINSTLTLWKCNNSYAILRVYNNDITYHNSTSLNFTIDENEYDLSPFILIEEL